MTRCHLCLCTNFTYPPTYLSTHDLLPPAHLLTYLSTYLQSTGLLERDANLWKAYFRANAEFATRCHLCLGKKRDDPTMMREKDQGR